MPAATINLIGDFALEYGATNVRVLPIRYPNGDPVDLTDYLFASGGELRGQFRLTNVDSATVVFQVTNGGSDADPTPSTGVFIEAPATAGNLVVVISDTDGDAAQDAGHLAGVYDIEGESSAAFVARLVAGNWAGSKQATRTLI